VNAPRWQATSRTLPLDAAAARWGLEALMSSGATPYARIAAIIATKCLSLSDIFAALPPNAIGPGAAQSTARAGSRRFVAVTQPARPYKKRNTVQVCCGEPQGRLNAPGGPGRGKRCSNE
jgi:hypothetical protein